MIARWIVLLATSSNRKEHFVSIDGKLWGVSPKTTKFPVEAAAKSMGMPLADVARGGPAWIQLEGIPKGHQGHGCMGKYQRLSMMDPSADMGEHYFSRPIYVFQNSLADGQGIPDTDARRQCGNEQVAYLHYTRQEGVWSVSDSMSLHQATSKANIFLKVGPHPNSL